MKQEYVWLLMERGEQNRNAALEKAMSECQPQATEGSVAAGRVLPTSNLSIGEESESRTD